MTANPPRSHPSVYPETPLKDLLDHALWLLREPLDFYSKGDREKIREARSCVSAAHLRVVKETRAASRSPTADRELKDLLDEFQIAFEERLAAGPERSVKRCRAARQSLVDYVEGIRAERDALRERIIAGMSYGSELEARFSSLKEDALTDLELDDLDSCIGDSLYAFERRSDDLDDTDIEFVERCTALRDKISRLRRIPPPEVSEDTK